MRTSIIGRPRHPPAATPGIAGQSGPTPSIAKSPEYDYGTRVYRPPARLDALIRGRDRVCRFPGCRRAARFCDLDHRIPFVQGGPTCPCNLDALCRAHHRLKTFTGWSAIRLPGDRLVWTPPLGDQYGDDPEPLPGERSVWTAPLDGRHPEDPGPLPANDDPPPF